MIFDIYDIFFYKIVISPQVIHTAPSIEKYTVHVCDFVQLY